ncbi:hypothetical protein D3C83_242690 [compost metagenome]
MHTSKLQKDPIDVHAVAEHISSMQPQSGMAIEEIEQAIAGMAAKAGVPVLLPVSTAA